MLENCRQLVSIRAAVAKVVLNRVCGLMRFNSLGWPSVVDLPANKTVGDVKKKEAGRHEGEHPEDKHRSMTSPI